jgi:hypothetical protein
VSKLFEIYEDSMTPVGWTFKIPLTPWWVRWSRRRLSIQRQPRLDIQPWERIRDGRD